MAVGSNVDNKESTGICRSNQQSIITISSFQENSFGLPYQDHNYGAPPPPTPPLSPKLNNLQPNGIVLNKTPLKSIVSSHLRPELTSTTLMPPLVNGYRRSPVKISTSPVILNTPLEGALECICGVDRKDGLMIRCKRCSTWQHMECMKIDKSSIPENYMCNGCYDREPNGRPEIVELKTMHDKVPNSENEAEEDEDTSTNPSSVRVMYSSVQSTPTSITITTNKNNNKKPANECSLAGKKRKRSRDDTKKNGKRIYNYQIQLSSWEKRLIDWRESYQEIEESQYSEKLLQAVLALGLSQPDSLTSDGASNLIQLRQQLAKVQQLRHKLMSMEDIGVSQPVAEVKGIYITTEELQLSEEEICVKQYPHVFWYHSGGIGGQLDMCVDARASGNNARFIRKSCCSNCEIRHIFEKDRLHLFVYSKKSISNGEEITLPFDYKYDESDFVVDCACTSPDNCLVYKDNLTKQDAGSNHIATAAVNPVVAREIEEDSSQQQQRRISPLILTISRVHQECNGDVSPNPSTGTGTDNEAEEPNNGEHRRKKSREDRKLEAYIKAFEMLEQKEKKKELGGGNHATTEDKQQQYNSRRSSRDNQQETAVEQQQSAHADNTTTYVVLANDQLTKSEQDSISETSSKDTSTLTSNAGAKRSTRKKGGRATRKGSRKSRTVSVEETSSTPDPFTAAVKTEPLLERSSVGADQNDLQNPAAAVAPHTLDDTELSLQAEKHPDEADGRINHVQQKDVSLSDTTMETAINTCESTAVEDHQDGCITTAQHELLPPSSNHTVPPPNETEDVYIRQITTLDGGGGVETDSTDHCRTVKSDAAAFCSKPGSETSSNHVASSKTQDFGCGQQHHDGQTTTTQSSIENSLLQMTFQPWEFTPGVPCRRVRIKSVRRHRRTYANTNCTSLKKLWLKNADEIETSAAIQLPEDAAPVSEVRSFKKRFLKQYSDSQTTTLQTVNIETEPPPPPLAENHENSATDANDDETSSGLDSEWNNNDSSSEITGLDYPNRVWRLGGTSAYSPYETASNNTTPITTDADHVKEVAKEEILEAETDAALSAADNDDVDDDDTDVACMSSVKSMTPDIEIPGAGNVLNMLMNPLVNDERPTMMNTVKKKVSLQEYLKRTKETKKSAAAGGGGAAPSAAHTNTTSSSSSSLTCSTDSESPKPTTTVANNDSSSSSSAVTTTITTTTTNRHISADKSSETNNTNDTSSSLSSSPAAASVTTNTDIPVNSKESCDDVPIKNNNSRASVTSQVVPVVKGSNNINSDVSSTPLSHSTLNDSSIASSPSSTSSTLSSTTKSAIITTNSNSVRTKPITTAAVAPTAAVNSTSTASNNMSNSSKVSACDEESLNADKVLALIKNSCEGLNAQSLTELTNAITSEDIYKNVPPEITSLITQAIKTMKENNGGRQQSAEKPRGGSSSTTTASLAAAAKSSLHKTVTAPGKMQSLSSPTRHPSPRQSRSHSLMSGSPSVSSSRPLTESSRHSSVDSLKDAAEGGKHRRISGTSTTSNHSNHPLSPAFKERTFHSVSQHKTANNNSKASESPGHSSSKTSASPITSGQPIPSLVSRRPDNTAARVPQVVYGRRESPLTSGSPAAMWDAFGSPSSQDQFYRSISSPRSRQQSPSSRSSRPVSPRSRGGNHSPAYRSSSPSSSDRSSYRRTSSDWQSPRSYSRDDSSRGSKYPSQSSSKFATPGRSVSPQRTTDGNNGGHHYCQAPSRGGSDRSGSPGGGPMRSSSSSRDASNYYYSKHSSSSSSYNDQHPYNRSSGSSSSKYYQLSSSDSSSSYRDRR